MPSILPTCRKLFCKETFVPTCLQKAGALYLIAFNHLYSPVLVPCRILWGCGSWVVIINFRVVVVIPHSGRWLCQFPIYVPGWPLPLCLVGILETVSLRIIARRLTGTLMSRFFSSSSELRHIMSRIGTLLISEWIQSF